ncbi:hypothetical protein M0813_03609 [Anaeramoeba flamelloides]|uniref:Uncharacterized protein n=1 Tax=Anaeramoeba flamelloides TaxID=1746091 RepID=A0ABQ8XS62_9EUKA|nr:hypothetical protein M0813_03609 [Anaeramoeba flamelloides]
MCEGGYSGSYPECLCFCNQESQNFKEGDQIKCNYFPSGEFSSGGCSLCGPDDMFTQPHSDHSQLKTVAIDSAMPFTYYMCICPMSCDAGYTGSYDECTQYCKSQNSYFLNGVEKITYFPWGEFSSGGCSCCGHVNPCQHE